MEKREVRFRPGETRNLAFLRGLEEGGRDAWFDRQLGFDGDDGLHLGEGGGGWQGNRGNARRGPGHRLDHLCGPRTWPGCRHALGHLPMEKREVRFRPGDTRNFAFLRGLGEGVRDDWLERQLWFDGDDGLDLGDWLDQRSGLGGYRRGFGALSGLLGHTRRFRLLHWLRAFDWFWNRRIELPPSQELARPGPEFRDLIRGRCVEFPAHGSEFGMHALIEVPAFQDQIHGPVHLAYNHQQTAELVPVPGRQGSLRNRACRRRRGWCLLAATWKNGQDAQDCPDKPLLGTDQPIHLRHAAQ